MIAALFLLAAAAQQPAATTEPTGYPSPPGLVLGVDAMRAEKASPGGDWPDGAVLRRDEKTGEAWRFDFAEAATFDGGSAEGATELYVTKGTVQAGGHSLGPGDYLRIDQGLAIGTVAAAAGAEMLAFRNPPAAAPSDPQLHYVHGDDVEWTVGQVAREAGAAAPLMIRRLFTDPETGARTHLVRLAAGVSVPWEIHSTAEEGYLLDGDYKLAECLPDGRRDFDYRPGGYFYRPASLIHSGPTSTTTTGATWLIRTPRTLDAVFYASCPSAPKAKEATP